MAEQFLQLSRDDRRKDNVVAPLASIIRQSRRRFAIPTPFAVSESSKRQKRAFVLPDWLKAANADYLSETGYVAGCLEEDRPKVATSQPARRSSLNIKIPLLLLAFQELGRGRLPLRLNDALACPLTNPFPKHALRIHYVQNSGHKVPI